MFSMPNLILQRLPKTPFTVMMNGGIFQTRYGKIRSSKEETSDDSTVHIHTTFRSL